MFHLGIIEESLKDSQILVGLSKYLYRARVEEISDDEYPIWHINEYHVPDNEIDNITSQLEKYIKSTWYSHAFNDAIIYVVMLNKTFRISTNKDSTWDDMIEYGVAIAKVDRSYIENIPLWI